MTFVYKRGFTWQHRCKYDFVIIFLIKLIIIMGVEIFLHHESKISYNIFTFYKLACMVLKEIRYYHYH